MYSESKSHYIYYAVGIGMSTESMHCWQISSIALWLNYSLNPIKWRRTFSSKCPVTMVIPNCHIWVWNIEVNWSNKGESLSKIIPVQANQKRQWWTKTSKKIGNLYPKNVTLKRIACRTNLQVQKVRVSPFNKQTRIPLLFVYYYLSPKIDATFHKK